jgi:hypothetical protein
MCRISPYTLKEMIVRTRASYRVIDSADWDAERRIYRTPDTQKWEQAARESVSPEWVEITRILAQGWDYYGGSDLPGERGR